MAEATSIEWADATWNPITGCSVHSPGCTNCYAMRLAGGRLRNHPSRIGLTKASTAGPVWNGQLRWNEDWLKDPLKWKTPSRIFVCAHSDLFHDAVTLRWQDRIFAVMAICAVEGRQHRFQVLTKRSSNQRHYFNRLRERSRDIAEEAYLMGMPAELGSAIMNLLEKGPLPNVWAGVSIEDQRRGDERAADLRHTEAALRWLSMEPLIGGVNVMPWLSFVDWVVVGGESGRGARPMHPAWARAIRNQCEAAGVPFLFKQWGTWSPARFASQKEMVMFRPDGSLYNPREPDGFLERDMVAMYKAPKKQTGRLLDGKQHDGMPA